MNPYQKYQQTKISTAPPEALILMLYDGALKFATRARNALMERNINEAHNSLVRCQDIVYELNNSLDLSYGEIAENMERLYGYISERLIDANIRKEVEPLDDAVSVLMAMRETWAEAMSQMMKSRTTEPAANAAV